MDVDLWLADFPWPTPDLWLTGDQVDKLSAIGQPTRPTQPSIPSGSAMISNIWITRDGDHQTEWLHIAVWMQSKVRERGLGPRPTDCTTSLSVTQKRRCSIQLVELVSQTDAVFRGTCNSTENSASDQLTCLLAGDHMCTSRCAIKHVDEVVKRCVEPMHTASGSCRGSFEWPLLCRQLLNNRMQTAINSIGL